MRSRALEPHLRTLQAGRTRHDNPAAKKSGARIVVPVALEGRGYDIHIGRHQLCEAAA